MGDEDNNDVFQNFDEDEWLTDGYSTTSPNYSDVETWIIEQAIEAQKAPTEGDRIEAKRQLYLLKCKLDRVYDTLPEHPKQERDWDKQEVHRVLKEGK